MKTFFWDIMTLAGLVLLSGGAAWMYAPLGLVIPGAALLALGLYGARYGPAH